MRQGLLIAATALWAGAATAQTVTLVPRLPAHRQALAVNVGGRVATHSLPGGGTEYEHQWPGVYFESRFKGTKAYLAFNDTLNEYRVIVDDGTPLTLNQPGKGVFEVAGLAPGTHTMRLEKVTESQSTSGAFDGFSIPASERPLSIPPRVRQMEFIGDSSMTGYGDRSTTRKCTDEERRARTDTQQGYAALTAKHFNADYQINAVSGRGLIRNYGGFAPEAAISHVYANTLIDGTAPYNDPTWQPRIVVVELGADFAKPLTPGEHWATQKDLEADFNKSMLAFTTMLHQRYPTASILTWAPSSEAMKDPALSKQIGEMEAQYTAVYQKIGFPNVGFVPSPSGPNQGTGCDYHGSLTDLKNTAMAMVTYIDAHPELWGPTAPAKSERRKSFLRKRPNGSLLSGNQ